MKSKIENENTWHKAVQFKREKAFHSSYEAAVEKVKKDFGSRYPNYIGGEAVYSSEEFAHTSPADRSLVIGYFQKGTREDTKRAIEAARVAFSTWANVDYAKRVKIFRKTAQGIRDAKFELAALISFENGKNRYEAIGEVDEALDFVTYYCYLMETNKGYTKEMGRAFPNETTRSVLRPYGVWGIIVPFNAPLGLGAGMSTGAMITGNTIVFKPASDTPLLSVKLYEITKRAGLPKGVMNHVTGPGDTAGRELVENESVSGINFTGSKEVGYASYTLFSQKKPRPFIAELGGKNPVIVTKKADLDNAVEGIVRAAFGYSGQKCSACSRVFVEKEVKERFLQKLVDRVSGLKVEHPIQRDAFVSPLINQKAYESYKAYVKKATAAGRVLFGGNALTEGAFQNGYFVEPTVVSELPNNHELLTNELFVPILCVSDVSSLEEALTGANNVEYGLTAGIFSEDRKEIDKFFECIEAGVAYANRKISATTGAMIGAQPFGGWKASGSSGKGAGGEYYLLQFMREQSRCTTQSSERRRARK
jgi:1-pyrroline-5-carboxylate dehydrogenase